MASDDKNTEQALEEICERLSALETARSVENVPTVDTGEPLWIKVEVGYQTTLKLNFHDYKTSDAIMALFLGQVQNEEKGYERIEITPWKEAET